ncbi:helix-hairpin-helix domain-containing protein [Kribbella sp. NPDC000426]|uniref:ComEA family DNA-binding protein n=1 Tax=Kribbella sp. NPDC000426 TaxID=3154255 RepID=UPI00333453A2
MDTRTQVVSWLWAISPLVTLGLATPVTFLWAAQRVRSRHYVVATIVYTALVVVGFIVPDEDVTTILWCTAWLAGTAHALAFRSAVFAPATQETAMEEAADAARDRRALRAQARRLAADDPGLARELGIGRPDVQRNFDDGGLIDVNSVPAEVLQRLPGMTAELAQRVVQVRESRGPYTSVDELSVFAELPPDLADRLGPYFLFLGA